MMSLLKVNVIRCLSHLLLLCGIISINITCQNAELSPFTSQIFRHEDDSCRSIQFLENQRIIFNRDCQAHSKNDPTYLQKLNGEIIEQYCHDLRYRIDSVDINNGNYISAYDRNQSLCHRLHIIDHGDFWVVTPLKQAKGIASHFTQPVVYKKANSQPSTFTKKLILNFYKNPKHGQLFLAYGQAGVSNSKTDSEANIIVNLREESTYHKTNLIIDPTFYAMKNYEVRMLNIAGDNFINIPTVDHKEYTSYLYMNKAQQKQFHDHNKIKDYFIVVYRFNPGRDRVVNKGYNETIQGQVQTFQFVDIRGK